MIVGGSAFAALAVAFGLIGQSGLAADCGGVEIVSVHVDAASAQNTVAGIGSEGNGSHGRTLN